MENSWKHLMLNRAPLKISHQYPLEYKRFVMGRKDMGFRTIVLDIEEGKSEYNNVELNTIKSRTIMLKLLAED